jgi:hypothetical protein
MTGSAAGGDQPSVAFQMARVFPQTQHGWSERLSFVGCTRAARGFMARGFINFFVGGSSS